MMWVYQTLDIIATLTEALALYIFSICLCKQPRFRAAFNKLIIIGVHVLFVYAMTWFTELGAYKMYFAVIFDIAVVKFCYKDPLIQCTVSLEFSMIATSMMSEGIGVLLGWFIYHDNMLVMIDGNSLMRWEIYVITLAVRIITLWITYMVCRKLCYRITWKDFLVVTAVFLIAWLSMFFSAFNHLNLGQTIDTLFYLALAVLPGLFILFFLYVKNTMYLRDQEQRDKVQIAQLQQQYAYYQDKQKDEERIRSIYHDMKNHLLVLESSQATDETRKMAQELRSQIADYEDYVHTGNEFLDIILKDKAAKARDKQIDFSAMVDFHGIDFMEPLDISTIFGNAIDNAIEASENLPEYKRLITVKAERVRDMLLITIENNTLPGNHLTEGTTKKNRFVHGFGIPNIKKAAEKYDGQCSFHQKESIYQLKILIPCP